MDVVRVLVVFATPAQFIAGMDALAADLLGCARFKVSCRRRRSPAALL